MGLPASLSLMLQQLHWIMFPPILILPPAGEMHSLMPCCKRFFFKRILQLISGALAVKLVSGGCHSTLVMINQLVMAWCCQATGHCQRWCWPRSMSTDTRPQLFNWHTIGWSLLIWPEVLTHWGWVMHICIGKLTIIGSDNGLSPGQCQAIIWTNAGILLIWPLGTKFSEILIKIHIFSFKKMHWNMSS